MSFADELLILDPVEEATGRYEWDITTYVGDAGPDYGDAAIEAYLADAQIGSVPVDFRVPNRTVTIPLGALRDMSSADFHVVRDKLQQKVGLFQREGGILARDTLVGRVYADIVSASLKLGGSASQAHGWIDPDASLTLECLPDWYEAEVDFGLHSESTLPWLVWTETDVRGNFPLGNRCRLLLTDAQGQDQLGALWGFRSRHYSSASTARLAYEAESLTEMEGFASAFSGASGGGNNTMRQADLGTNWAPILNTNISGAYMTHKGTYRVFARVYSSSTPAISGDVHPVQLRFVWDVGDMTNPVENEAWRFPNSSQFYIADLGEIRLDEVPAGTHRWQGQIQGKGAAGGEQVRIDTLMFLPLDEAAGRLVAPFDASLGLAAYSARDEFNQSAGALTGKTLPVGGTWTVVTNSDADNFTVETAGHTAQRTATLDTGTGSQPFAGRAVSPGTTSYARIATQIDFKTSAVNGVQMGAFSRLVDSANHLSATVWTGGTPDSTSFNVWKRVAGTLTTLHFSNQPIRVDTWFTIRLMADAAGRWAVWYGPKDSQLEFIASGQDSDLATGGTLASGRVGFVDFAGSGSGTRNYDNFAAWVPAGDAVAFASQSLDIRTDGAYREDSAGNAYGPVTFPTGDNPRLPQAGLEDRTVEVFAKLSRGDLDQIPDTGIDDVNGRLYVRRSWLYVPDALGS